MPYNPQPMSRLGGLNAGVSNWGSFRGAPETTITPPPQEQKHRRGHRGDGQNQKGIDSGPSKPMLPSPNSGGGINVGRTGNMGILPSPMDPYRTYGSVDGGAFTPPTNPYGQNQPIRFTPGGEYGSSIYPPGPINTGPSQMPSSPYMEGGGFTGNRMPQPIPPFTGNPFGGGMRSGGGMQGMGGIGQAYKNRF